jgi:ubiquitin C-terminal hydrolase
MKTETNNHSPKMHTWSELPCQDDREVQRDLPAAGAASESELPQANAMDLVNAIFSQMSENPEFIDIFKRQDYDLILNKIRSEFSSTLSSTTPAPMPIVFLNAPCQISPPLIRGAPITWPEIPKSPSFSKEIKQFLEYLAYSDEGKALLVCQGPPQPHDTLRMSPPPPDPLREWRSHLSAVVEKVRNPQHEDPLTWNHLHDLQRILKSNKLMPSDSTAWNLLLLLCEQCKLQEFLNHFEPIHSEFHQIVDEPDVPMPAPLSSYLPSEFTHFPDYPDQPFVNFLKTLAASEIATQWLQKSPSTQGDSFQSRKNTIQSKVMQMIDGNLRNHLIHVIHTLRNPEANAPLLEIDLHKLKNLITKREGYWKFDSNAKLLKFICQFFNGTPEEFSAIYSSSAGFKNVLEKPTHLGTARPILPIEIQESSESFQALLKILQRIAESTLWDKDLMKGLSPRVINRQPGETEAAFNSKRIDALTQVIIASKIQAQVAGIVQLLRESSQLEKSHLVALSQLIGASNDVESILSSLSSYLNIHEEIIWKTIVPEIWNEAKEFTLREKELPKASDDIISKTLTNIGNTCYLNSLLQMIARLSFFDEMLTKEIQTNVNDDYKVALQSHLRTIVGKMRTPPYTENIEDKDLTTLFHLLQVNGWHKRLGAQQDPHELLITLRRALEVNQAPIHSVNKYTYQKDGKNYSFTNAETSFEFTIDMSFILNNQFRCSLEELIEKNSKSRISGYKVEGEEGVYEVDKKSYIVSPAPTTLFIHQLRFSYNTDGSTFKLNEKAPFSSSITRPIYNPNDLDEAPINHTYELKVVIGHEGESLNLGHYTTLALQKYPGTDREPEDCWFCYDDTAINTYLAEDDKAGVHTAKLQEEIEKKGYYLAYVLKSESTTSLLNNIFN